LRSEGRMRAVIERESHQWKVRSDTINDIGGDPLEERKHEQRLGPNRNSPIIARAPAATRNTSPYPMPNL
jgi:hypothetical protein